MVKVKNQYVCDQCGGVTVKWLGQCPHCNAWNSLIESAAPARTASANRAAHDTVALITPLNQVQVAAIERLATGSDELDRVLGGGLVTGSVVLIGGDPGIGKSTLLLQSLAHLAQRHSVLYVNGEESVAQVALRARRLGFTDSAMPVFAETQLEIILQVIERERPMVVVVDSIQTVFSQALASAPGSVAQVRECAAQLTRVCKGLGVALVLIGHVTKEGTLAGPRVLEHIVDAVLYFEGEQHSSFRLIRAFKNRFGAVNEIGVFAMTDKGLREVSNPSALFLSQHSIAVSGSCVLVTQEGTRPLLVEVQALVDSSSLGNPKRLSVGLEQSRLAMLLAVLHRHAGIASLDQDVFVNAVGGVRIGEPAADLAIVLAIVSSLRNKPLPKGLAVFGEIGLAGEIRPAPRGQDRIKEAAKLGFSRVMCPSPNLPKSARSGAATDKSQTRARNLFEGVDVLGVDRIEQALSLAWD